MRERRLDPTTEAWTIFAPDDSRSPGEPCVMCAAAAALPPDAVLVVDDPFPPLTPSPSRPASPFSELYRVGPAVGAAEVVIHSRDHDLGLTGLTADRLEQLVDVWARRYAVLGANEEIGYVHLFADERTHNGSASHPHSRILGYPEIPPRPRRKLEVAAARLAATGTCVLCDVVARERSDAVRAVASNKSFVAHVPFAARVPHEVHVVANRHATSLLDLTDRERAALAEVLHEVLRAFRGLFGGRPEYGLSVHQAPTEDAPWLPVSHLEVELFPLGREPRAASWTGATARDTGSHVNPSPPESDAAELRSHLPVGSSRA